MSAKQAELAERYGVKAPYPEDQSFPAGELFPDRMAWIIRQETGLPALDVMQWGFPRKVPGKRVDPATGKPAMLDRNVTNVRNLSSPFWRSALANPERRCLVSVTAFSEYGPGPTGKKPLYWFDVPSRPIFSFAGIWRPTDQGGVFAFLTTEPNSVVAPIHPKAMPVILHSEDEARWLSVPIEEAVNLVAPYPSQLMSVQKPDPARDRQDDEKPENGELDLFKGDTGTAH